MISKANVAARTRAAPTTPQGGFMKSLDWALARQIRAKRGDDEPGKTWNACAGTARTLSDAAFMSTFCRWWNMENERAIRKCRKSATFIIGEAPGQKHELKSAGTRCSRTYRYGRRGQYTL